MPPVTTPGGALLQAIAFAAVGGESSVSEIVMMFPLLLAAVPSKSIPGHAGFATPSSPYVSRAGSVTEWSLTGHVFMRPTVWFLDMLRPWCWRENLVPASL